MRAIARTSLVLSCALIGAWGCGGKKKIYTWGEYNTAVRHLYSTAPQEHLVKDRDQLALQARETEEKKKIVPPGMYAHIGYLCMLTNDAQSAEKYFMAEKLRYPESTVMMDTFIQRLRAPKK